MLLPTNIATGRVTGQFLAGVVDGADDDQDPDAIPASGFVTFTASVPYLPDPTATPNPATILTTSVVAVLDGEGYLCTPSEGTLEPSYRGVRLIATDDPDLSVSGWTWNATYSFSTVSGQKLAIPTHSFAVPSDGVVDLTTVVKVPSSTGIGTEQAEALAASAQAAAIQAAQDAATAAQAAVDAAAAAQVTDSGVASLVSTPGSATALEVANLVDESNSGKLNTDDAINTYQSQAALDAAAAAKVQAEGTSLNAAVKAIADNAAGPKLDAATAATTYAAKSVETTKLDVTTAATTYTGLSELYSPALRFDQFPAPLTDQTMINSAVTAPSTVFAGGWVFAVFFGSDMNPYIARVRDGQSSWELFNLGTLAGNPLAAPAPNDEHNNITITVDVNGFIHVWGNHHRVPLNYIRSTVAYEITGWEAPGMVGTEEAEVTYPYPIRKSDGVPLFMYRSGTSSDGDTLLNSYNAATKTWSRVGTILKGHAWGGPTTEFPYTNMNPYIGRIAVNPTTGRIHMWWLWRGTITSDSNTDLHYAYSDDGGTTWKAKDDSSVTLPALPSTTNTRIFAGQLNHVVSGGAVDSAGNPHAIVRVSSTDEMRHYKIVGGVASYDVIGTASMGDGALFATPDGKVYYVYTSAQVFLKQVHPTIGDAVRIWRWTVNNYRPNFAPDVNSTGTLRLLVAPSRAKPGGNYGGVLTMPVNDTTIANLVAGKVTQPRPAAPPPITDQTRIWPGCYPMAPGMYYGPAGARANSPALVNGTFRGQIVTAARAGTIVECSANVVTAGAAGSKIRFVIYRMNGKVAAQSADIDVTTTGLKTGTLKAAVAKNEQVVVGTLHHSSTASGAVFTATGGSHDSRIALGNATSYFTSVRSGFALSSVAVPAVDQSVSFDNPAAGASVASNDNVPLVVIKTGDLPADWSTNE